MIDRLYKSGDNCSDFQKSLRLFMLLKHVNYQLSSKELELVKKVTQ